LGYQLLGRSEGVGEDDACHLRVWCPSHDSLADLDPDSRSVNFHSLPSGCFCVSLSTSAGWEYSGRGGHRVYTQCLIVSPQVLRKFSNSPFAILRAAEASGLMKALEEVPANLPHLNLVGRSAQVDQDLLARLASDANSMKVARFIQAARESTQLAVAGQDVSGRMIPALFSCLPLECRTAFSFTTGLKYSSRRPFRIVAVSDDDAEHRWLRHQTGVRLLDLDGSDGEDETPLDDWSRFVNRALSSGRTSLLARELSKQRPDLLPADLPALGLQLIEDFEAKQFAEQASPPKEPSVAPDESARDDASGESPPATERGKHSAAGLRQAHAAHNRFVGSQSAATTETKKAVPSAGIDPHSPEVLRQLEHLDDVVFDAISGKESALSELRTLWPHICESLGEDLLAESREQYVRYALTIWEEGSQKGAMRYPSRAVQALDVLSILFDGQ